jgi:hypothetical protein
MFSITALVCICGAVGEAILIISPNVVVNRNIPKLLYHVSMLLIISYGVLGYRISSLRSDAKFGPLTIHFHTFVAGVLLGMLSCQAPGLFRGMLAIAKKQRPKV